MHVRILRSLKSFQLIRLKVMKEPLTMFEFVGSVWDGFFLACYIIDFVCAAWLDESVCNAIELNFRLTEVFGGCHLSDVNEYEGGKTSGKHAFWSKLWKTQYNCTISVFRWKFRFRCDIQCGRDWENYGWNGCKKEKESGIKLEQQQEQQ